MKKLNVIKWWGENAGMLRENSEVLQGGWSQRVIVVSAMRSDEFNTTSKLQEIGELLNLKLEWYENWVQSIMQQSQDFHFALLSSHRASDSVLNKCKKIFQDLENILSTYIKMPQEEKIIPSKENDYSINYIKDGKYEETSLIWWGEYISARLNALYLWECQNSTIKVVSNLGVNKDFYENISRIWSKIQKILSQWNTPIFVPWYLGGTWNNILSTIGRWYSDATASLIAVSMKNKGFDTNLSIEKMVEWFLSADPRIVDNPKLIEALNYLLAKEIITESWPAAKLLHPESLNRKIQEAHIPVRVYNPFSSSWGTIISSRAKNMPKGIFYIGWVEDIKTLTYSSGRLDTQWFIANTSRVLAEAWVNIKEAFWTATEQSYAFSSSEDDIQEIIQEMKQQYGLTNQQSWEYVKYQENYSLIYCVGNMKDVIGTLHAVTWVCEENAINVKAIAQWLQQRAIVIVVERLDYKKAINALHTLV